MQFLIKQTEVRLRRRIYIYIYIYIYIFIDIYTHVFVKVVQSVMFNSNKTDPSLSSWLERGIDSKT